MVELWMVVYKVHECYLLLFTLLHKRKFAFRCHVWCRWRSSGEESHFRVSLCALVSGSSTAVSAISGTLRMLNRQASSDFPPLLLSKLEAAIKQIV